MKRRIYTGIALFVIMLTLFIIWIGKINIGLFIDKLGLTKNVFDISVSKDISSDNLYIYWFGEPDYYIRENREELNKVLIYHKKIQSDILDSYGKNEFFIKYQNVSYNRIGIFKLHAYSKYNYKIDFKLYKENLIINWSIKNWYDPDIVHGCDTLKISN